MDKSNSGSSACSGGAGYLIQAAIGGSGVSNFSLTASEEYRNITISIAPNTQSVGGWQITQEIPFEYDSAKGKTPALVQLDATHYLCAYSGDGDDGWATVLTVDTGTCGISRGTPFEFDTEKGKTPDLVKIDTTHYLCAYAGDGDDGWATVLTVDTGTWGITKETPFEYDSVKGKTPAQAWMDTSRYLCAYAGDGDDGWATVLTVDTGTWSITQGTPYEYDAVKGKASALEQLNTDHYLCVYAGDGDDGWAVVLTPSDGSGLSP